eukprot:191734-Amphidinium_carterae.1
MGNVPSWDEFQNCRSREAQTWGSGCCSCMAPTSCGAEPLHGTRAGGSSPMLQLAGYPSPVDC